MTPPASEHYHPCANYYERKRCTVPAGGFGRRCEWCTMFNNGQDLKPDALPDCVRYSFPPDSKHDPKGKKVSFAPESSKSGGNGGNGGGSWLFPGWFAEKK